MPPCSCPRASPALVALVAALLPPTTPDDDALILRTVAGFVAHVTARPACPHCGGDRRPFAGARTPAVTLPPNRTRPAPARGLLDEGTP